MVAFGDRFQIGQSRAPEHLEIGAQVGERISLELIQPLRAIRPVRHESGLFEDFQVLRHRRPAHRQAARELPDGPRSSPQRVEDRAPRRVAECIEDFFVSLH